MDSKLLKEFVFYIVDQYAKELKKVVTGSLISPLADAPT